MSERWRSGENIGNLIRAYGNSEAQVANYFLKKTKSKLFKHDASDWAKFSMPKRIENLENQSGIDNPHFDFRVRIHEYLKHRAKEIVEKWKDDYEGVLSNALGKYYKDIAEVGLDNLTTLLSPTPPDIGPLSDALLPRLIKRFQWADRSVPEREALTYDMLLAGLSVDIVGGTSLLTGSAMAQPVYDWLQTQAEKQNEWDRQMKPYEWSTLNSKKEMTISSMENSITQNNSPQPTTSRESDEDAGYFTSDPRAEQTSAPSDFLEDTGYFTEESLNEAQQAAQEKCEPDVFTEETGAEQSRLLQTQTSQDEGNKLESVSSSQKSQTQLDIESSIKQAVDSGSANLLRELSQQLESSSIPIENNLRGEPTKQVEQSPSETFQSRLLKKLQARKDPRFQKFQEEYGAKYGYVFGTKGMMHWLGEYANFLEQEAKRDRAETQKLYEIAQRLTEPVALETEEDKGFFEQDEQKGEEQALAQLQFEPEPVYTSGDCHNRSDLVEDNAGFFEEQDMEVVSESFWRKENDSGEHDAQLDYENEQFDYENEQFDYGDNYVPVNFDPQR